MFRFTIYKQMRIVLAVVILLIVFIGCSKMLYPTEWGKRLEYKGSSLFYTSVVMEAEARKLGDYLLEAGFFQKGNPGTVQITKKDDVYQFRIVVKEGTEKDMEFIKTAGLFAASLSRDVFDKKHVEIHLCDKELETLIVTTFQIIENNQEKQ